MFDRVLLVNPAYQAEWRGLTPHIGQAYLAESLQKAGIEYDVLDMNLGYKPKHVIERIKSFHPDLIGFSLLSLEYRKLYALFEGIKEAAPTARLAVGGPHVTIMRDQVLRECTAIDYGVVYEGEHTLVELCLGSQPEERIKGLISRADGNITYAGDRPFETNLDALPWPRYRKFELDRYTNEMTIYSSRGCPQKCTFCPNRIISPYFRARSSQDVVDEVEYWYSRGYRQFNFDDDNFNQIRQRVIDICDLIKRRGLRHLFLRCSNGIRADRVDRDLLARMREVGFRYIAFGVDGGNNKTLEIVRKGETIEAIEEAVKNACELNYDVKLLFVVGTPHETREDVEDKVRLSKRYPVQEVHFYNTIPYPGTELYDWVAENNRFLIQPARYLNNVSCLSRVPVFDTPELPRTERLRLHKYLGKVRRQVHKDAVLRVFGGRRFIGTVASHMLTNGLIEKLFYQNIAFRRVAEGYRYKLAAPRGSKTREAS